MAMVEIYC